MWSYHKYLIRFKEQRKKSLAGSSPGMLITITNTNHKLTTSIKATKAPNIQIRLLVEESQQLNSKKWKTRKKHKLSANESIPIKKYIPKKSATKKKKKKKRVQWNELKGEEQEETITIYHSYSFVTLLSQQRCRVKWPPWSLEDLPIEKGRRSRHFTGRQHQIWRSKSMVTVTSACFKIINLPHEITWGMHILVLML